MANIDNAFSIEILSLNDEVLIADGTIDPSSGGYEAPEGSLYLRKNGASSGLFYKDGALDTDWNLLASDHTQLSSIGTNTHAQIDTHISSTTNPHTTSIDNLDDTTITTPLANDVLTYSGGVWIAAAPPGASGGEANTASNVGTAGIGVFKQKTVLDLEFKKINAGSSKVTITDDTGNDEIDIDIVEGNILHNSLSGFVANEHIDWTADQGATNLHAGNYTDTNTTDHTAFSNIGTNTHAQIDTHVADATLHFTEASIVHQNISGAGTNTHAQIDTHIADATLHFTEASIVHQNISGAGTNTHAQIDTHIADATLHFTEASIVHQNISGAGTNTHAQIDTHIADVANPHQTNVVNLTDTVIVTPLNSQALIYDGVAGDWKNVTVAVPPPGGGRLIQVEFAPIGALSGTATIPVSNLAPTTADGTLLWSDTITPTTPTSAIRIHSTFAFYATKAGMELVVVVFRDDGTTVTPVGAAANTSSSVANGANISFTIYDTPTTLLPLTYSIYVGKSGGPGTWYINSHPNFTTPVGGIFASNSYSLEEIGTS